MSDTTVTGNDFLEIANSCWREGKRGKPGRYAGFAWVTAVGKTKQNIEKVRGNRKERQAEAEHTTQVLFDHARKQQAERLDTIAREAQAVVSSDGRYLFGAETELYKFSEEVVSLLNGPLSAGFGAFDPSMIMSLIMAIVNAIKACRSPAPTPVPAV